MKTVLYLSVLLLSLISAGCASRPAPRAFQQPTVVEAACGECKFGMKGDDCELAIRFNGQACFVDGVKEVSLGDPHAADGICMAVRQARVRGEVKNGRFVATQFELLPATKP